MPRTTDDIRGIVVYLPTTIKTDIEIDRSHLPQAGATLIEAFEASAQS